MARKGEVKATAQEVSIRDEPAERLTLCSIQDEPSNVVKLSAADVLRAPSLRASLQRYFCRQPPQRRPRKVQLERHDDLQLGGIVQALPPQRGVRPCDLRESGLDGVRLTEDRKLRPTV